MPTPKKARFRLTMDKKCLMEARITADGHALDVSTQIRQGREMDRFVIDCLFSILWNVVDEDDIRLRALVFTGMRLRGLMESPLGTQYLEEDNPPDTDPVDDIPF